MRLRELLQRRRISELGPTKTDHCVFVCYPDDEGVKNNAGRPGAAEGPSAILQQLERLPVRDRMPEISVLDEDLRGESILQRHELAETWVSQLLKNSYRVVSLGGGHDYAYPDLSALWGLFPDTSVVNVDAHLDVREFSSSKINSGTAFRRLAERFPEPPLIQWGINWVNNSKAHLEFCQLKKIPVFSVESVPEIPFGDLGFSICLDAFEGIRAVSAPSFYGLKTSAFMPVYESRLWDMRFLGLYEVAPSLDPNSQDAARLASQFAYRFVMREALMHESSLFQSNRHD